MALLVSACGFTEPRKFIVVKEGCDIDGSFLISALIGQRLRQQNSGLVLVCCHQTCKYYDTCGRKLGYNLSMSVNKGNALVIEPLMEILTLSSDVLMDLLFNEIYEKVSSLESDGKKSISVIIDDLSFFTNLGCSENDLIKCGMKLHELTQQKESLNVTLKIGLSGFHPLLSNNIEDFADVLLSVARLKSGNFWDVDGKLIIRKVKHQGEMSVVESERNLLYFIGDHNVKLSAPGEIGLKV